MNMEKDAACRKFQIPEETLNRYLRAYRKEVSSDGSDLWLGLLVDKNLQI